MKNEYHKGKCILKKTDLYLWMLEFCRCILVFTKTYEDTEFQQGWQNRVRGSCSPKLYNSSYWCKDYWISDFLPSDWCVPLNRTPKLRIKAKFTHLQTSMSSCCWKWGMGGGNLWKNHYALLSQRYFAHYNQNDALQVLVPVYEVQTCSVVNCLT